MKKVILITFILMLFLSFVFQVYGQQVQVRCDRCRGTGRITCITCNGSGRRFGDGTTCTACRGLGVVNCAHCRGSGFVNRQQSVFERVMEQPSQPRQQQPQQQQAQPQQRQVQPQPQNQAPVQWASYTGTWVFRAGLLDVYSGTHTIHITNNSYRFSSTQRGQNDYFFNINTWDVVQNLSTQTNRDFPSGYRLRGGRRADGAFDGVDVFLHNNGRSLIIGTSGNIRIFNKQ